MLFNMMFFFYSFRYTFITCHLYRSKDGSILAVIRSAGKMVKLCNEIDRHIYKKEKHSMNIEAII